MLVAREVQCKMERSCLKTTGFVVLVLWFGCATGRSDGNGTDMKRDRDFFLKQIFDKYGDHGVITFEGFEHLLENLGLGRLVFEKEHALSLHKMNGSFQEMHDSLSLHQHSHTASTRRKRQAEDTQEYEKLVKSHSESLPVAPWTTKCLTPQDLLETFGLEPQHSLIIAPDDFLNLCPAIVYELDQHTCYSDTDEQTSTNLTTQHSAWLYASLSVMIISLIGLFGVVMVPLVQRNFYHQLLHFLVALAVGTMCGDALFHLLPHAMMSPSLSSENDHIMPVLQAMVTFLAIAFFFLLEAVLRQLNSKSAKNPTVDQTGQSSTKEEKLLNENENPEIVVTLDAERVPINHQHSHDSVHQHKDTLGSVTWMVIMGDGMHNLTDGLAIGAAFSGDNVAGFATALAVLCHELPHELGDFAVLLKAGMSVQKAVVYNIVSSVLSFTGMAVGVWIGEHEAATQWIYAFTAGTFLYISLADLIPEMKSNSENSQGFLDVILHLAGIITGGTIMLIIALYEDNLTSLFN